MSDDFKPFIPTLERALNLSKEVWNEKKQQVREQGYNFESFTMHVCKQLGFNITHDEFIEWVANGRVPVR